jgi:lipoprotein-anchoring transpeptidase ErfK/SrfK
MMRRMNLSIKRIALVAICCLPALAIAPAAEAKSAGKIKAEQATVSLLGTHSVRTRPSAKSKAVARVSAARPITGERTVMPVLAHKIDNRKRRWLKVRLPGRVLGAPAPPHTGWISASNTMPFMTVWHVVVSRSARKVTVYRAGHKQHVYSAIVGAPDTPTPSGNFFVEENIRLPAAAAGAPFALALNARSSVFQEFEGGPGQIAIHGMGNIGGDLGTAASHGCVRLSTPAVTWLAKHIGQGVPVTIN